MTPIRERAPGDAAAQLILRNCHANRAVALDRLRKFEDAVKDWDRAIGLTAKAQQPLFQAPRATSRVNAGQTSEALAEVAELTKL